MLLDFPPVQERWQLPSLDHALLCRGVVSLAFLPEQQQDASVQQIAACTRGGTVSVYNCSKADTEQLMCNSSASFSVPKPVHSMVSTCLTCNHCILPSTEQLLQSQDRRNSGCALQAVSGDGSKAAFGCQGAELSIWDIETQQKSYSAKGAKPNRVGLMDLPDNTAVTFIPGSEAAEVSLSSLL